MVIKRFLKKVGLSIEDVLGEFEILGVCFSKEDMDIESLRKIGLLENNGVHDYMYFFFLFKKKMVDFIIGEWIHGHMEFFWRSNH